MKRLPVKILLLMLMCLAVYACSAPPTPQPAPLITIIPTPVSPGLAPETPQSGSQPTIPADQSGQPSNAPPPTVDVNLAVQAAKNKLAAALNISADSIQMIGSPLPVEWGDTSLGCPEPGQAYPQVITPGFIITLSVGEISYEVHTDQSGNALICQEGLSSGGNSGPDPVVLEFIEQAKRDLATRLGVSTAEIVLVRSEAVEWSDASLGCREEGQDYAQVITPGYRIVLARGEQHYHYHADQHRIFICANPTE